MKTQLAVANRHVWALQQFGHAQLGDVRRTRRLVTLATQMARDTAGSIHKQTGSGADMKAAYRLFAQPSVTHHAVCETHWNKTRQQLHQMPLVLLLQDTTELDFTSHAKTTGLAPIGNGSTKGMHQHNVLAADPKSSRPVGLFYQKHHRRQEVPQGETRAKRRQRSVEDRESFWWVQAIQHIGSPPQGTRFVHVMDRGGDAFAIADAVRQTETDMLVRAAQNRCIVAQDGQDKLFEFLRGNPALGTWKLPLTRRGDQRARTATLSVSCAPVTFPPPKKEPRLRHRPPLSCSAVRVWEANPRQGVAALEWILLTTLPVDSFAQAKDVGQWYSLRWLIEEFHKCEKTGCNVEARRLCETERLEPLIGLLSVLAVYLLQLKYVGRDAPNTPAREVVGQEAATVMAAYVKQPEHILTVRQFWRGIGLLGGHAGRSSDGPLGWLRAWRGWQAFSTHCDGSRPGQPGCIRGKIKCG